MFTPFKVMAVSRQLTVYTKILTPSRMGTKASAIARLESALASGKHSPSLNTLRKYAATLGKRVELHLV
jgi:hypothetical protein